ncbi:MAG: S-methyl-5-thioribose-1-phosphate isomerase [Mycobacterium leprae]
MRTVELMRDRVKLIDQRRLPNELVIMECTDYRQVGEAIKTLAVRGAPAIGVTAAGGMSLAAQTFVGLPEERFWESLSGAAAELAATRPTAVNLFWAIQKVLDFARTQKGRPLADVADAIYHFALGMADEDVAINRRMAEIGQTVVGEGTGILTHCNTGALATVDWGTALGVIRMAHDHGKQIHVYVDETRPVLQGARLTAWECVQWGIPATLITDNMAAHMMRQGKVQLCLVGADRIAANGDTANKIGTYGVAVLAREHGIPFYVVAPSSTVDLSIPNGDAITIEERDHREVTHIGSTQIAPDQIEVANPAFDVTPAKYITGIITELGIVYPPFMVNMQRILQGGK